MTKVAGSAKKLSPLKDFKEMSAQSEKTKVFDFTKDSPQKTFNYPEDYLLNSLQIGPENETVAVVIDGSNLFYLSKLIQTECLPLDKRFSVDYDRLAKILSANFPNLRRKWYVTSQIFRKAHSDDSDGYSSIRALLDFLSFNRYEVVTRDITIFENENDNRTTHPPSLDVDITTCLFRAGNIADHVVFIGSDRRYATPLQALREMGKSITVMSVHLPNKKAVSDDLRKIDNFVNLASDWFIERLNTSNRDSGPRNFEPKAD